jgi:hypothetical protein
MITLPEGSYRLWRVVLCDQETSRNEEAITLAEPQSQRKQKWLQIFQELLNHLCTTYMKNKDEVLVIRSTIR